VDSSPALARDGAICFGSWDRRFYTLKPDGSLKWQFETGGPIESSPAIGADETIYFGSHDRKFYALTRDGGKRWEYATGGPIISSPALNGDGVIYFTSVDGFLYALTEEGRLKWRLHTGGITGSSPVIGADGVIYAGVNDSVWAVTPDGARKGVRGMQDFVESTPAVAAADTVYALPRFRDLVALDSEMRVVWFSSSLHAHGGSPSPVIGPGGVVYVPDGWSHLCALEARVPAGHTPWPRFRCDFRNTGHAGVSAQ
jgi:outer membrane protein assembly factor BamB